MKTETIVMCIFALILGLLIANMLMNVCGCKVVEGKIARPKGANTPKPGTIAAIEEFENRFDGAYDYWLSSRTEAGDFKDKSGIPFKKFCNHYIPKEFPGKTRRQQETLKNMGLLNIQGNTTNEKYDNYKRLINCNDVNRTNNYANREFAMQQNNYANYIYNTKYKSSE